MKDFTKTQKIIKVGNSHAVTLDSKFVEENELKAGDQIIGSYSPSHVAYAAPKKINYAGATFHEDTSLTLKDSEGDPAYGKKLTQTQQRAVMHSKVTPELQSWTNNFLTENKQALEELANL